MATDTVHETEKIEINELWKGGDSPFRSEYGKLMMWYFLLSDAFTFAGFLIAYGSLRFSMNAWPVPDHVFSTTPFGGEHMPLIFVTIMTFILIVSSVTALRAVQEGKMENSMGTVKWLVLTIIGGGIFLGCQAWEWTNLIVQEGVTIYNNPFSSHLDDGKYITLDEAKKIDPSLKELSMTIDLHTDKGHETEELKFLYDSIKGQCYFEKFNHHYFTRHGNEEPQKAVGESFKVGDPYLIAYHAVPSSVQQSVEAYKKELLLLKEKFKKEPSKKSKDKIEKIGEKIQGLEAQIKAGGYFPGAYKTGNVVVAEEMGPVAFGTLFFFITGFHGFHVLSGLVILLVITLGTWSGVYRRRNNGHVMVEKVGLYWHFVDLVWVFVFLAFYLL